MTIEQILDGTRKRTLFDSFSHEFKENTVEQKIILLASLNYYGLLDKAIRDYKVYYKDRKDILSDFKSTILYLYSEVTTLKEKNKISGKNINFIIKKLKEELKSKIEIKYSIDDYIESFLLQKENEIKRYYYFFKVNLTESIEEKLLERNEKENKKQEESYLELYNFLTNNLLRDYHTSNYQGYMVDMGMNYQVEYLVKHYLQNRTLTKSDYLKAIKYAYKILYFEKKPYHKFFLVRVNLSDKKEILNLYNSNEIAIHFNTKKDLEDYSKLINEENPKQQYVNRWKTLSETIKEEDVIIVSSYQGIGYKFGVIQKGTKFNKIGSEKEFLLKFKLIQSKEINIDKNPSVQTIIPSNVTISPINKKNYKLRKEYYSMIVQLPIFEFDDNSYEIIVNEWLRSKFAPKKYQIKYQLLKIGGNKKDIDIYGLTKKGEKLIVQVSDTNDKNTIKKKINKLEKYDNFIKLFFFKTDNEKNENYEIINLDTVISDFKKDKEYKELLNEI